MICLLSILLGVGVFGFGFLGIILYHYSKAAEEAHKNNEDVWL
jgi:hypothetical protein